MNQAQALTEIDTIHAASARLQGQPTMEARARALVMNPDDISQGPFGVCAMTTAVRSLLQYDREKYTKLLRTLFDDQPFYGTMPPASLWATLTTQVSTSLPLADARALDFLLARALGVLFEQADPVSYSAQVEFSRLWNPYFGQPGGTLIPLFTLSSAFFGRLRQAALASAPRAATAATADANRTARPSYGVTILPDTLAAELSTKEPAVQYACGFGIDLVEAVVLETTPGRVWQISYPVANVVRTLTVTAADITSTADVTTQVVGLSYEKGHLAMDVDGMVTFLQKVARFTSVSTDGNLAVDGAVGRVNRALASANTAVYAAITASREFMAAKALALTPPLGRTLRFDGAPRANVSFYGKRAPDPRHWVDITGPLTQVDPTGVGRATHYRVPVWSWNTRFQIDIPLDQLNAFLHRWVIATVV
jgi:hypothetical protein